MIKQILTGAFLALILCIVRPTDTAAAETDNQVKIDDSGYVTLICDSEDKDGVNTLQLSLNIETESEADVSFKFNDDNNVKISEYRYNEDSDCLNIYMSGTESFLNEAPLNIGCIIVSDKSGNDVAFNASAAEESLKYVYNNKLVKNNIELEAAPITTTTTTTTTTATTTTSTTTTTSSSSTTTTGTTTSRTTTTTTTTVTTTTTTVTTTTNKTTTLSATTTSTMTTKVNTNLPQTGNNSINKIMSIIGAFILIGLGSSAVIISGICRNKKHDE